MKETLCSDTKTTKSKIKTKIEQLEEQMEMLENKIAKHYGRIRNPRRRCG
jgi:chaperonin cofactor prefoldin